MIGRLEALVTRDVTDGRLSGRPEPSRPGQATGDRAGSQAASPLVGTVTGQIGAVAAATGHRHHQ